MNLPSRNLNLPCGPYSGRARLTILKNQIRRVVPSRLFGLTQQLAKGADGVFGRCLVVLSRLGRGAGLSGILYGLGRRNKRLAAKKLKPYPVLSSAVIVTIKRSEERRVGKECR